MREHEGDGGLFPEWSEQLLLFYPVIVEQIHHCFKYSFREGEEGVGVSPPGL